MRIVPAAEPEETKETPEDDAGGGRDKKEGRSDGDSGNPAGQCPPGDPGLAVSPYRCRRASGNDASRDRTGLGPADAEDWTESAARPETPG
ncbi:MAG: hypothetical protein ACLFPD_11680 [Desulfosudaceae bacterium]